jgi:hypothetical protein
MRLAIVLKDNSQMAGFVASAASTKNRAFPAEV